MRLERFVEAQEPVYEQAIREIRAGRKQSHWMWFVFPQLTGLGTSDLSRFYGLADAGEARAYLAHPVLGPRLVEAAGAALSVPSRSARDIFGTPDDLKLRSCATLFASVTPPGSVFARLIDRFFDGIPDPLTLERLRGGRGGGTAT